MRPAYIQRYGTYRNPHYPYTKLCMQIALGMISDCAKGLGVREISSWSNKSSYFVIYLCNSIRRAYIKRYGTYRNPLYPYMKLCMQIAQGLISDCAKELGVREISS